MKNTTAMNTLIDQLLDQIQEQTSHLNQPMPPDPKKQDHYKHLLKSISKLRGRPLFYPYLSSGLGKGPLVQLEDGSVKLDFICGIGPHILGHSHPELIRACLKGALEDCVMQGHLQMSSIYNKTLAKLIEIAGKKSKLVQGWICPSGSMANENALKIIRQKKQGARKIIAFERAFAGRTSLTSEITDNPAIKVGLPTYNEVLRVPFCPDQPKRALQTLKKHYAKEKNNLAVFIMELMQGDGGCFQASPEFFIPLMEFCKNHDITVWLDEIQTFGRSGQFFAFETLGLGEYVDVCTVGKALQMSAVLWTQNYNPKPGLISGTFASSTTSYHSALSIINILEPYMGEGGRIQQIQQGWRLRLQELEQKSLLSQIQGWGLMWGATPSIPSQKIPQLLQTLFQKGLICFSCGDSQNKRLRFLLPAIVKDQHLDQAIVILQETLMEYKN